MDVSTLLPWVESAAPKTPEGPTERPEPSTMWLATRGPKAEVLVTTVGVTINWACAELLSKQAAATTPNIANVAARAMIALIAPGVLICRFIGWLLIWLSVICPKLGLLMLGAMRGNQTTDHMRPSVARVAESRRAFY